jgi:hypothetical protein
MDIIKKNLVSVICGAVALVAVVVGLLPLSSMFDDLTDKTRKRLAVHQQISALLSQSRKEPVVDLENLKEKPLSRFPNREVIDWGDSLTKTVEGQARRLTLAALAYNDASRAITPGELNKPWVDAGYRDVAKLPPPTKIRFGMLEDWALPTAAQRADVQTWRFKRDMAREGFRDKYDDWVRNYAVQAAAGTTPPPPGKLVAMLGATVPPTPQEIAAEQKRIEDNWPKPAAGPAIGGVAAGNPNLAAEEQAKLKAAMDAVPARLRTDRAASAKLYIDPVRGLFYNAKLAEAKNNRRLPDNDFDIWWAQLGLWIQQDVVQAIVDTHAKIGARNVYSAAIKNLLQIEIGEAYIMENGPRTIAPRTADAPGPRPGSVSMSDPAAAFRYTPTGRVGNDLYDVVHFRVVVDIDARHLPLFVAELGRERLITVRAMGLAAVDRAVVQNSGLIYSEPKDLKDSTPVVRATIRCEAVFLREWAVPRMPDSIKKDLLEIHDDRPRG